jgi:hypothetical protein
MTENGRAPGFFARLRVYLLGIAIGLIMLGFFQMAKKKEAAQRQAAAERARVQPAQDPLFPPVPPAQPK